MVDVKSRRCSCGKSQPHFGMPGGRATHCKECKEQGMVDVKHDGKRRKCSCGKSQPSFGMPGGRATHCKECKEQGMVDVINRRCSCGKCIPSFGMLGGSATHCKECKEQDMVNVASTSKIVYAHGVFWLRLKEKFAEHQEPFGPKTHKKQQHTPCAIAHPALPYSAIPSPRNFAKELRP